MTNQSLLRINLLGRFQVAREHDVIPLSAWRLRSAAGLVKLLALAPDHRLHREQLMDALWPEADPEAAANNLRYSLHAARRTLANAAGALQREGSMLVLGPTEQIWTDVGAFEDAVATAWQSTELEPFQQAAALYAGDLLPEDLYEEWALDRRAALRASYLALLGQLAELHERRDEPEQAISTFQLVLAREPTLETAHVRLMRLFAVTGRRQLALAQYERLVEVLHQELGVKPDAQARELLAAIQQGSLDDRVQAAGAIEDATPRPATPSRVPVPLDELIDRRREIAEVGQLLATKRLVTLTGPGGIGKTRLAIAIAHVVDDVLPDGAVFVSLAPVRDPQMIVPTVARALGLREQRGQSLEELVVFHLRARRLLMVLDNCEHVLAGAPLLAELLGQCPQVRVLATSRTRLGLAGEQEYAVGPLRYPDPAAQTSALELANYPAVSLFVRRAREVQSSFTLTEENGPAVAEVCWWLRGLPLALGLAAARSKVLTPQMMLARLDRPLELLTGGPRDAPERQQTMRNTIQWSYDLLVPDEQLLLHVLSVFAGGWTLAAAEAVAGECGCSATVVLDGLTSLVDNNLVTQERPPGLDPRFSMLEPVREFGLERLADAGQSDAVRERHARYFAALAEPTTVTLEGPEPQVWLDLLEAEHDNFRAALRWATAAGVGDLAQWLAGALWEFWSVRGYLSEGRHWLAVVLELDDRETMYRAGALRGAGELGWRYGEYEVAEQLLLESLALYKLLGDEVGIARALNGLGLLEMARSRLPEANAYLEASIEHAGRLGDERLLARAKHNLGGTAVLSGDYETAKRLLEETVALARRTGGQRNLAYALANLGVLAYDQGDYEQSRIWKEESLSLFQSHGDRGQVALLTCKLGQWAFAVGDLRLAQGRFDESLVMSRDMGHRPLIANIVRLDGQIAVELGDPQRAARLFGAAELMRETVNWNKPSPSVREAYERALRRLMTMLAGNELAAGWAEGRRMSVEEAIDYALDHTAIASSQTLTAV